MSLRQAIGGDAARLHELLEQVLDTEDAVVLLFDGHRAVNYISGFGLSPCQQELMALEIERVVRAAGVAYRLSTTAHNISTRPHERNQPCSLRL